MGRKNETRRSVSFITFFSYFCWSIKFFFTSTKKLFLVNFSTLFISLLSECRKLHNFYANHNNYFLSLFLLIFLFFFFFYFHLNTNGRRKKNYLTYQTNRHEILRQTENARLYDVFFKRAIYLICEGEREKMT